jgi:uracil-DNA glycosylase
VDRKDCARLTFAELIVRKYVQAHGSPEPKLMILSDSPTEKDEIIGRCLTSEYELDKILRECGVQKHECWMSTVSKYYVPPNFGDKKIPFAVRAKGEGIDLVQQINELQVEINQIKPNCILALGSTALWALSGKKELDDFRGSILFGMGRKFIPTFHPRGLTWNSGAEFKGFWNRQIIAFDIRRAKQQADFSDIRRPPRTLRVCRNSAELVEFIERKRNKNRVALDIEALHCIPTCLGLAFDRYEGMSVPLWNVAGLSRIPDADLAQIWLILAELLMNPKFKKVGQNFKYDEDKISRLGLPIDKLWSDTMLKAFAINPELPKNLGFITSIFTEEPYYKHEGADFNPNKQPIEDLFIYNARDAAVTLEIDEEMDKDLDELGMREYYENFIMQLHPLYLHIESVGFKVDNVVKEELLRKYVDWNEKLKFQLWQLTGGLHVNKLSYYYLKH